ncbi:MAG: hypothetical protein G01um10147_12 [Microgenomates group bacterium Gr01-1014_7]|nr:MAG: hypothetical protein G01um10147_12 [Microgenomates group bacterium Gr01-1014_7]
MKNPKTNNQREFLPTFADLVDTLSIDQIKEIKLKNKESYAQEMNKISYDIDLLIKEKDIKPSAKLIRLVIIIAQVNLFIWENKDKMKQDPKQYDKLLKLSHQLNGIRNRMKNLLLEESGEKEPSKKRTNIETEGLKGWESSLK